jgi:hypothetical protein
MVEGGASMLYGASLRPYLLPPVDPPVTTGTAGESGQWRFWSGASIDGDPGPRQWRVPPVAYSPSESAFAITTGEPVSYISKSAPLEQLRKNIVWSWVDGHIQDPMFDIIFAHDYDGGASSKEQLELLVDKSTLQRDSEAALLCTQEPDAPNSHPHGRDGFSLGSLRIIVRGQVTPVYISDGLLPSSSFVSWAAIRNIRKNEEIRKLGRDAIGTGKGMLLLFAVAFVIKVTN